MHARFVVLYPIWDDEWNETQWSQAAASNPALDFLKDPEEDIYSPTDGKPFHDQAHPNSETPPRPSKPC